MCCLFNDDEVKGYNNKDGDFDVDVSGEGFVHAPPICHQCAISELGNGPVHA